MLWYVCKANARSQKHHLHFLVKGETNVETGSSCTALKKSGVFTSGHYVIKEEGKHNYIKNMF